MKIAFGENGTLTGTASGQLDAIAKNTNGAANASSLMDQVAGIANDGAGLEISMGLKGDVVAKGDLLSNAKATTVTGPAAAVIGVTTIGGLIDRTSESGSSLTIGTVGKINAIALGRNTSLAEAVTTAPKEHVSATVDNDEVIAVRFPKIAIGTDAVVSAGAQSIQEATAIGVNNGGDPLAKAGPDGLAVEAQIGGTLGGCGQGMEPPGGHHLDVFGGAPAAVDGRVIEGHLRRLGANDGGAGITSGDDGFLARHHHHKAPRRLCSGKRCFSVRGRGGQGGWGVVASGRPGRGVGGSHARGASPESAAEPTGPSRGSQRMGEAASSAEATPWG